MTTLVHGMLDPVCFSQGPKTYYVVWSRYSIIQWRAANEPGGLNVCIYVYM